MMPKFGNGNGNAEKTKDRIRKRRNENPMHSLHILKILKLKINTVKITSLSWRRDVKLH